MCTSEGPGLDEIINYILKILRRSEIEVTPPLKGMGSGHIQGITLTKTFYVRRKLSTTWYSLLHGQGTGTIEGKFLGQWKYEWKHDRGTYFDSDGGVIYECEYKYGRIYGKGTQYYKDGSKIIFEHRKMIYPYDHMSKIWNQTEYYPDGKII